MCDRLHLATMPFCMPITCNRQIDSLDRRQNNLAEVPHDIARYRGLEELILTTNHISVMPKSLFSLTKLRLLDMSDNDLNALPADICHLVNLVELNLRGNNITDIPEQLKQCKSLMLFDLSSNPITRLPDGFSMCTSLTHFAINDVSLTQLPADIGNLVNLRSLLMRENLIRALPPSITKLVRLEVLDLGQNEIDQLPIDIGSMESLRELYIDMNELQTLPDQITQCTRLEQLDATENELQVLPEDLGRLDQLTDLTLSNNKLQILPASIGRLKKLSILKLDSNELTALTDSIGSCERLTEVMLTQNLLRELPASIGNLRYLKHLNVDKNQLTMLPATIGGCTSLSILSLRDNQIAELPIEIGKCELLSVLDLATNKLNHLPFTINVLFKLKALWLSEDQPQAMVKLQQVQTPQRVKVLTCYLLPQDVANIETERRSAGGGFLGGPKVHFPDQDATVDEDKVPIGQFERHDTPKPHKAQKEKLKKSSIDGHVIPHEVQHSQGATLALHKKGVTPESSPQSQPVPTPRSALKFQSTPPTQYEPEPLRRQSQDPLPQMAAAAAAASTTPVREFGTRSPQHHEKPGGQMGESIVRRIRIRRDQHGGLGLSIAGGLESTPYKEGDNGLFVSKVNPGGPADLAGLRVGDKMIRVNNTDVTNAVHDAAVQAMKQATVEVELMVQRGCDGDVISTSVGGSPPGPSFKTPDQTLDMSFMSDAADVSSLNKETISATLKRDGSGSPGFSVAGGAKSGSDTIFISSITPGGPADRHGNLAVGDRVLSINGTKMKGVRHDQVVRLLTGHSQEEVYLVVQRDRSFTSPLPSTPVVTSAPSTANTTAQSPTPMNISVARSPSISVAVNHLGDTSSWDGRSDDVELNRDGKSLGLSIVGGCDHACHPFGVDHPGVFISKIAANSPAARSQRLRVGDRILSVNNVDVRGVEHRVAVEALKHSGSSVRLRVTHDPQPSGLREVVVRKNGGPLGISIYGGVGNTANPHDSKDEGIFVEKVEPSSVGESAGLQVGHRIIEVNGESLLGMQQREAVDQLKSSDELRLLVCNGFNRSQDDVTASRGGQLSPRSVYSPSGDFIQTKSPSPLPPPPSSTMSPPSPINSASSTPMNTSTASNNGYASAVSSIPVPVRSGLSSSSISSAAPRVAALNGTTAAPEATASTTGSGISLVDPPLATSSPLPAAPATAPKPSRIPPPVAPKPRLPQREKENDVPSGQAPEMWSLTSKLKKFEREIEVQRIDSHSRQSSASSLPPPEKRSLLSDEDVKILKEAEVRKVYAANTASPEKDDDSSFEHLLDMQPFPRAPSNISIRTKKAENAAIAAGLIPAPDEPLNDVERRAMEQQKRSEWRAARLKSLDQERQEADAIMSRLQLNTVLSSINEDSSPCTDKILENETTSKRSVYVDPVTGERSVTVEEASVTRRQIDLDLSAGEIGFADE